MRFRGKIEIGNELVPYFDINMLRLYMRHYNTPKSKSFDKILWSEVQKITHDFHHVSSDVLYMLAFGLREILKFQREREAKEDREEFRREMSNFSSKIRLLMKISEYKYSGRFTIKYKTMSCELENTELLKDIETRIESEISKKFMVGKINTKNRKEILSALEQLIDKELGRIPNRESNPYNSTLQEFAFSIFKYLSQDKVYDLSTGKEGFVHEEKTRSPKKDHISLIARIYEWAGVTVQRGRGNKQVERFTSNDMNSYSDNYDLIKKHIKDGREYLNDIYNAPQDALYFSV